MQITKFRARILRFTRYHNFNDYAASSLLVNFSYLQNTDICGNRQPVIFLLPQPCVSEPRRPISNFCVKIL